MGAGREGGGVFICCLAGHLTIDHASLSRWSTGGEGGGEGKGGLGYGVGWSDRGVG